MRQAVNNKIRSNKICLEVFFKLSQQDATYTETKRQNRIFVTLWNGQRGFYNSSEYGAQQIT